VDGKITADMNTPGGEVVKMEFDPTTTDPNKVGYIDYARDLIRVYNEDNQAVNWVVVTEDTVTYSPRRGNSIGGLDAGATYFIIQPEDDPATTDIDESKYIQLARNERDAIDGKAIDLTPPSANPGAEVSLNTRSFDASDIVDDQITFPGVGNTFELGQAVIYHEGSVPIPGLVDGSVYYVMAGTDQFNLTATTGWLADRRFAWARSRTKLAAASRALISARFRSVVRILPQCDADPRFRLCHLRVLSKLEAADEAGASAGLTDESPKDYTSSNSPIMAPRKSLVLILIPVRRCSNASTAS